MIRSAKFLACALLMSSSHAAMAQSTGWTVSEAAGTVIVRDGSGDRPVRRGTVIAEGATLSTGPGARAVVVRGKDFMTVNANSRVRIPVPADKRGMFDVLQEWGNALFQIEKKPNPHFGVRTPYLAAVVKGTTFSVTRAIDRMPLGRIDLETTANVGTVHGGTATNVVAGHCRIEGEARSLDQARATGGGVHLHARLRQRLRCRPIARALRRRKSRARRPSRRARHRRRSRPTWPAPRHRTSHGAMRGRAAAQRSNRGHRRPI